MSVETREAPTAPAVTGRQRRARRTDKQRADNKLGWMLAGPAFAVMLLVTAYPILQATWDSLWDYRLTTPDDREFVGLSNYAVILSDPLWWRVVGVTLLITVITVVVDLVLGKK